MSKAREAKKAISRHKKKANAADASGPHLVVSNTMYIKLKNMGLLK